MIDSTESVPLPGQRVVVYSVFYGERRGTVVRADENSMVIDIDGVGRCTILYKYQWSKEDHEGE